MPLKNTYSTLPAGRYIDRIEIALVNGGANGIGKFYDEGRIVGLNFSLNIKGNLVNFKMPVNWKKVQQVLINEEAKRAHDEDYAYRVSWAIMCDWVEAQMAIIASENVTMPQLFLPFAVAKNGNTLYDAVMGSNLLLN